MATNTDFDPMNEMVNNFNSFVVETEEAAAVRTAAEGTAEGTAAMNELTAKELKDALVPVNGKKKNVPENDNKNVAKSLRQVFQAVRQARPGVRSPRIQGKGKGRGR